MFLDHVSLGVRDLARATAFYAAALKPLGYVCDYAGEDMAGFGAPGRPQLWLGPYEAGDRRASGPAAGAHIAFRAASRADVDAFHAAALKAGAKDNGAPGLRPQYDPDYYGAFVTDLDGHHIEAVCRLPK
jgi:catechol 2,3-dioxygenase-like lactoylglutathione lyase family enzyme